MKKVVIILALFCISHPAFAVCTGVVKIQDLRVTAFGWMHIVAEGLNDIDIKNCGTNNPEGMLLNFNDASGTM